MIMIYCLISIKNEYSQPENNLVTYWNNKPTYKIIRETLIAIFEKENCTKFENKFLTKRAVVEVYKTLGHGVPFQMDDNWHNDSFIIKAVKQGEILISTSYNKPHDELL